MSYVAGYCGGDAMRGMRAAPGEVEGSGKPGLAKVRLLHAEGRLEAVVLEQCCV